MSWGERSCTQHGNTTRTQECKDYVAIHTCHVSCPYYIWNGKPQDSVIDIRELLETDWFNDKAVRGDYGDLDDAEGPIFIGCRKAGVHLQDEHSGAEYAMPSEYPFPPQPITVPPIFQHSPPEKLFGGRRRKDVKKIKKARKHRKSVKKQNRK